MKIDLSTPILDFDGKQAESPTYKPNIEKGGYELVSMKPSTVGMTLRGALNTIPDEKKTTLENLLAKSKLLAKVNNAINNASGTHTVDLKAEEIVLAKEVMSDFVQAKGCTIFEYGQVITLLDK